MIEPSVIKNTEVQLERVIYKNIEGDEEFRDWTVLSKAIIPKVDQPVPQLVIDYDFEVKDLPYKLKGWSDGQDLSKMDTTTLKKEVLAYYEQLRTMLNEGKIAEFMALKQKAKEEVRTAEYVEIQDAKETDSVSFQKMSKECPGHMWPIENYTLKLYAHGKLVKLIRTDKEFRGWDVLIQHDDEGETSIGVTLYKPIGSSKFKIIRK